jgi:hypothetical protein
VAQLHQQQGLTLLSAMRTVHLLLFAASSAAALMAAIAVDVLRLLPLVSPVCVALLATTAALAVRHLQLLCPRTEHGGPKRNGSALALFQKRGDSPLGSGQPCRRTRSVIK